MNRTADKFMPRLRRRRRIGAVYAGVCAFLSLAGLAFLGALLTRVFKEGWSWLTPQFLTNLPSVFEPETSGIYGAICGTLWVLAITAAVAVPVGIGAAIYLEEFAPPGRVRNFIQINISNLAGVPAIVYGILGLALFVRWLYCNRSVLAGGLTMSLLILPVIIIASREALCAVPKSIRLAAFALGATRWQTVRAHVLPAAIPGIMTGVILAMSRAIGEAAPLIVLGALTYVPFAPRNLFDQFTAVPIQIYAWSDQAQPEYQNLAAAGILVLLGILLPMNALAIAVRAWRQRSKAW